MLKLLVTVFFVACVQDATAIHCYECSSVNNSMCLDLTIYDKETVQKFMTLADCGTKGRKEFFCRKIVQTILHKNHDSEVRVQRGCGWERSPRACYKADNEDHQETVCQCFEDGCNAASSLIEMSLLVAIAASVVVIVNKG